MRIIINDQNEQWLRYQDSNYEVSNLGRVRNRNTGRMLAQTDNGYGYYYISINKKTTLVHRMVAEAFLPNPNKEKWVNHIDCDKHNNKASNLEWCSPEYNSNYKPTKEAQKRAKLQMDPEKKRLWIEHLSQAAKKKFMDGRGDHPKNREVILTHRNGSVEKFKTVKKQLDFQQSTGEI